MLQYGAFGAFDGSGQPHSQWGAAKFQLPGFPVIVFDSPAIKSPLQSVTSPGDTNRMGATLMSGCMSSPHESSAECASIDPEVLQCPECEFRAVYRNEMGTHLLNTRHAIAYCSQCHCTLVCRPLVRALQYAVFREKRVNPASAHFHIRVVAEENHQCVRKTSVPLYEKFLTSKTARECGLRVDAERLAADRRQVFQCADCQSQFTSATKLTDHLDSLIHSVSICAECNVVLKSFGSAQPTAHMKSTGHVGFYNAHRLKEDFLVWWSHFPTLPQFRCHCGVIFLSMFHLAAHMAQSHGMRFSGSAKCQCGFVGLDAAAFEEHRAELNSQHHLHSRVDVEGLDSADYVVMLPKMLAPSELRVISQSMEEERFAIVYQCPVCLWLFDTGKELLGHLNRTSHTSVYCHACRAAVLPQQASPNASPWAHPIKCHHRPTRAVLDAINFEVLVDRHSEEWVELLASRNAAKLQESESREDFTMYQCPRPGCYALYPTFPGLLGHSCGDDVGGDEAAVMKAADPNSPDGSLLPTFPRQASDFSATGLTPEKTAVTVTDKILVEHFGYVSCTACCSAVRPGTAHVHESFFCHGPTKHTAMNGCPKVAA